MKSERLTALQDMLAALPRAGMFRPDLHTLRHASIVAAFESLEVDGLVVEHEGALVPASFVAPDVPEMPHVGRVCFNLGLMWQPIGERLRAAGRTTGAPE